MHKCSRHSGWGPKRSSACFWGAFRCWCLAGAIRCSDRRRGWRRMRSVWTFPNTAVSLSILCPSLEFCWRSPSPPAGVKEQRNDADVDLALRKGVYLQKWVCISHCGKKPRARTADTMWGTSFRQGSLQEWSTCCHSSPLWNVLKQGITPQESFLWAREFVTEINSSGARQFWQEQCW